MILITDTNIVYSALINPQSIIASILKKAPEHQFVAPNYLKEEIKKHWHRIISGSNLSKNQVIKEWLFYQQHILFFDETHIPIEHYRKAFTIVSDIDPDDTIFVASHFYTGYKIWTSEKRLIQKVQAKGYTDIFITTDQLK